MIAYHPLHRGHAAGSHKPSVLPALGALAPRLSPDSPAPTHTAARACDRLFSAAFCACSCRDRGTSVTTTRLPPASSGLHPVPALQKGAWLVLAISSQRLSPAQVFLESDNGKSTGLEHCSQDPSNQELGPIGVLEQLKEGKDVGSCVRGIT